MWLVTFHVFSHVVSYEVSSSAAEPLSLIALSRLGEVNQLVQQIVRISA